MLLCVASASPAAISIKLKAAAAPNCPLSPHWAAFVENAKEAMLKDIDKLGDPTMSPAAFVAVDKVHAGQLLVTGFHAWDGFLAPAKPFDRERGVRLHFPVRIVGNGTKFRLADLSIAIDSTDPNDSLDWSASGSDATYSKQRVGIDYGPDGVRDTDDDVVYSNGESPTQPIDELIYVGAGIAAECTDKWQGATREEKISKAIENLMGSSGSPFQLNVKYTLASPAGGSVLATAETSVQVVAMPSTRPAHLVPPPPPAQAAAGRPSQSAPGPAKRTESPMPLFIGAGAGLILVVIWAGAKWYIRRRRFANFAALAQENLKRRQQQGTATPPTPGGAKRP